MSDCDSLCGHLGRVLVFLLTAGGCTCAFFAVSTCEFFSYVSNEPSELPPPYTNVTAGFVGLLATYDEDGVCRVYDKIFVNYARESGASAFFITAQFSAVVGPGLGAIAFFLNLLEWFCYSRAWTYFVAVTCLILACCFQGLSFIIYGQREFCFDKVISADCELEIGAILSMSAAGTFYVATIAWCCLSRLPPLCCKHRAPSRDNSSKITGNSSYLVGAPDVPENHRSASNEFPIMGSGAAPWDAQQQRQPQNPFGDFQPQTSLFTEEQQYGGSQWVLPTSPSPYQDEQPSYADSSYAQPQYQAPRSRQLPPSWQLPTAPWDPNDPYGNSGTSGSYDNPFASGASQAPSYEYQRPAYGNLQ